MAPTAPRAWLSGAAAAALTAAALAAAALRPVAVLELRNADFESHRAALAARGGGATPALWDGARLHTGHDAVLAAIEVLARDGR